MGKKQTVKETIYYYHYEAKIFKINRKLWRSCNLTAFIPCLTGPVDYSFAFHHQGPGFNPQGGTYVKPGFPVSVVSLYWWPRCDWSLWPRLRWASSRTVTRPLWRQCDNPTWSHTTLLSQFHARCRSSFWLHNDIVCWGGALWIACNFTALIPCLTGPVNYPFASCHEEPGFTPQGVLMWNRDSPVSVVLLQNPFSQE